MGFLDHSTNNIIIDAVLTNLGRERLASNAGQFLISKFSLADDEVDYSLIRKFGRTVGKEKIIKNTPIFEAQTAQDVAMKHQLVTIADPSTIYLPFLEATATAITTDDAQSATQLNNENVQVANTTTQFTLLNGGVSKTSLVVTQNVQGGASNIPAGMEDGAFDVFLNSTFLTVMKSGGASNSPQYTDPLTNIAMYSFASGATPGTITLQFEAYSLSTNDFKTYSDAGSTDTITTMISVVGKNSGARVDIVVKIKKAGN